MDLVYTGETAPAVWLKSIFLAGPSPRSLNVKSWRSEAIILLEKAGYDGVVFVPENRSGKTVYEDNYEKSIDWEHQNLYRSDIILFWVPRNLRTMPAFTTNVEFGLFANSGYVVFGAPPRATKNRYLKLVCEKFLIPKYDDLASSIKTALEKIGDGAPRSDGERDIPLLVWRRSSFQEWYLALRKAGNRLDYAKLVYSCRPKEQFVYSWIIEAKIFIGSEKRHKTNEIVISRGDISSVVLYRRASNLLDTEIVLAREFRSPVRNSDGFVWENPGGSSPNPNIDPLEVAIEEVYEENGLRLDPKRLAPLGSRQLAATFSAHHAHLFKVELTAEEINWFRSQKGVARGVNLGKSETGERVYTEVTTIREILENNLVDWSNLGMIFVALNSNPH
ncbi:MAG: nucleoside 2-deoxyribosyltransferase domain-containing protein [Patescibacteria group bacterium]